MDNPYTKLIEMMNTSIDESLPTTFRFGTVTAGDEEAVQKIDVGGIEYKSGEDELLIKYGMTLTEGDTVLLIPLEEEQKMLILCKVVKK